MRLVNHNKNSAKIIKNLNYTDGQTDTEPDYKVLRIGGENILLPNKSIIKSHYKIVVIYNTQHNILPKLYIILIYFNIFFKCYILYGVHSECKSSTITHSLCINCKFSFN